MRPLTNRLTLGLSVSSIILLLLLQVFWLRSVYFDELHGLQREAHILFRNTVFEMSDSLLEKRIKSFPSFDTVTNLAHFPGKKIIIDSGRTGRFNKSSRIEFRDSSNVRVYVYSSKGNDTIKNFLRPLMSRIGDNRRPQTFSITLDKDSLKTGDIERKFREVLMNSGIDIAFHVTTTKRSKGFPSRLNDFRSEQVVFTPTGGFRADFINLTWSIIKKITPQILFSLFLTLLTTGSFVVLYRSIRSQQKLMSLKNDFISNITHELKTPIATVSVALEALKNFSGMENPKLTGEYLEIAQHELGRLTLLTDKVLTTSLFDEHGIKIDFEKVDFEKTVNDVLNSLKLLFEKQKASVRFEKSGVDFIVAGSAVHLTNVVYNLLDNALKYSPSQPSLRIDLADLGTKVSLAVIDQGVGIPTEFQEKVFEKFFRMPTGDVHNIKGYGLGLSYVEGVVKAHKGTIEVKSEVGKGSTFTILIPK